MANPKGKSAQAAPPPADGPMYPAIESFIERASADEVSKLFEPIKEGLSTLKGPKVDQAKKVDKAIARAEELLSHLLQVREKLEADRKGRK